jgi:hypothetical protein
MAQHVALVLQICRDSQITKCTQSKIHYLAKQSRQIDSSEFGIDLLIQAWIVWERHGKDMFWDWQAAIIERLSSGLTL